MRVATDSEVLRGCTLYTSTEPCAMCAGAIHWGNVRRVVFALSQENLRGIAGGNPENAILAIPCREVFARGNHEVEVSGPHLQEQARCGARRFLGLSRNGARTASAQLQTWRSSSRVLGLA